MITKFIYYWQLFVGMLVAAAFIVVKARQASELTGNQLLTEGQLLMVVGGWLVILIVSWVSYSYSVSHAEKVDITGEMIGCKSLRLFGKWSGSRYYFLVFSIDGEHKWFLYDDNYKNEIVTYHWYKDYRVEVKGPKCYAVVDAKEKQ